MTDYPNITPPPPSSSPKWPLPKRFLHVNATCSFYFPHPIMQLPCHDNTKIMITAYYSLLKDACFIQHT